jgi:hypothetical protein
LLREILDLASTIHAYNSLLSGPFWAFAPDAAVPKAKFDKPMPIQSIAPIEDKTWFGH